MDRTLLDASRQRGGMYGARTFLIPAGATPPTGERAHNTVLATDGFSCYVSACR